MSKEREQAIEKIIEQAMADVAKLSPKEHKNLLGDKWKFIHAITQALISHFESLGYVQPKVSPDLEKAITELATELCESKDIIVINHIYNVIKSFLSANNLVQKAEDQSLPKIAKTYDDWGGKSGLAGYRLAQEDMLKAGWVKVKKE